MAKIRVRCPACDSDLEIDEAFEGQEVECGSCLNVFSARRTDPLAGTDPPRRARVDATPDADLDDERADEPLDTPVGRAPRSPAPADEDEPPPPRPLPRDNAEYRDYRGEADDDYDYEDDDLPPRGPNPFNGVATASLVLGSISVILILMTLPFACCCMLLPLPFTIPLSLTGIVTGVLGLRADEERKPLAVLGLILGLLCLGFATLQLVFGLVPVANDAR